MFGGDLLSLCFLALVGCTDKNRCTFLFPLFKYPRGELAVGQEGLTAPANKGSPVRAMPLLAEAEGEGLVCYIVLDLVLSTYPQPASL